MCLGLHFLFSLPRRLLLKIMIPCSEFAISIFNINLFVGDVESHPQSFMNLPRELDTTALFLKWLQVRVVYEAAFVPSSTRVTALQGLGDEQVLGDAMVDGRELFINVSANTPHLIVITCQ